MILTILLERFILFGTYITKNIALILVGCALLVIAPSISGCDNISRDSQTILRKESMELAVHRDIPTRPTPPIDSAPPKVETATFALG